MAFLLAFQLGVLSLFLALSSLFNLDESGPVRYFPGDFNNVKLRVQGIEFVQTNLKVWTYQHAYNFFPFSH